MPYSEKKLYRSKSKDWRKNPYAKAGEAILRGASYLHPLGGAAYDTIGKFTGFNTEKKCFDQQATATMSVVNGGTSYQSGPTVLTNIQQGDNGDQCNGNSVRVSDFMFRAQIFDATGTVYSRHRIILFVDRENQGQTPLITDILEAGTSALDVVMSPLNRSNFGRFNILKDHTWTDKESSNTTNGVQYIDWTFGEEKLTHNGEHHITWDATNVHGISNLRNGHIWFVYVGYTATMTSSLNPVMNSVVNLGSFIRFFARTRYVDN